MEANMTVEQEKFFNVMYNVVSYYEETDMKACIPKYNIQTPDRSNVPFAVQIYGNEPFILDVLGHHFGDHIEWKFSGESVLILMTENTEKSIKEVMDLNEEALNLWIKLQVKL